MKGMAISLCSMLAVDERCGYLVQLSHYALCWQLMNGTAVSLCSLLAVDERCGYLVMLYAGS